MIEAAVALIGLALVTVGVWMVAPWAAFVVLGGVLFAAGLLVEFPSRGGDS